MSPRRPKIRNLATIREQITLLVRELGNREHDKKATLRNKVSLLVNLLGELRDYGVSLISEYGAGSSAQSRIITYLRNHVGIIINGDELGAVAGISEWARRIRELRVEHGYNILSGVGIDPEEMPELATLRVDQYILLDQDPNEQVAKRWRLANQIRRRRISGRDRILAFLQANVGVPVTGDELRYVANIGEWARRVRELRTDFGWPVYTRQSGRPDLRAGEYVLESLNQARPHERKIPDTIRMEVLSRDNYTCTRCNWNNQIYLDSGRNPEFHRYLELHHIQAHVEKGLPEADNLITLCNRCHDEIHAEI